MGGIIYGPYTGTWFASTSETDIEHIVARSEAHDSGLCAADAATRRRFASDILNLTLASPSVNRSQKSGKDAAEWLPDLNRCWFASRVVEVRLKYALTVDERERDAIEGILSGCSSTAMIVDTSGQAATATPVPAAGAEGGALELYDDNGNGRLLRSLPERASRRRLPVAVVLHAGGRLGEEADPDRRDAERQQFLHARLLRHLAPSHSLLGTVCDRTLGGSPAPRS